MIEMEYCSQCRELEHMQDMDADNRCRKCAKVNAALNTAAGAAHDERSVDLAELRQKIREFREKHAGKCVWPLRTDADSKRLELEENPPKWVNCKIRDGKFCGEMDVWEL